MNAAQPDRQLRARPQLGVERRDLDGDVTGFSFGGRLYLRQP